MRLSAPSTVTSSSARWRLALVCLGCVFLILLWLFQSTVYSMVDIWNVSETYTHGYLILPISLWLIWKKRHELIRLQPRPAYSAALFLVLVLVLWAIAKITSISVVEQIAFVAMLVVCTWLILGHGVSRYLAFPLFFLFFSVPMGQDLVPPLMEFTADFTVGMLEVSGIPVYREGLYFEVPTGRWSVVEACSGIRYLIASVTLGFLYSYLVYKSFWRRLLFVSLSVFVPILANGLRAYFIVLLGHLSDMKLAVGVDHLIYGWVFFGLVMAILFWLGSFWSETQEELHPAIASEAGRTSGSSTSLIVASLLVPVAAYPMSMGVQTLINQEKILSEFAELPESVNGWAGAPNHDLEWRPYIQNPSHEVIRTYQIQDEQVLLYIAMFPKQERQSEALSSMNRLIDPSRKDWNANRKQHKRLVGVDMTVGVTDVERLVRGEKPAAFRVWAWYRIGKYHEANPYVGKLREVQNFLLDGRTDGAYITVATPLGFDAQAADRALERFVKDMLPTIDQTVDRSIFGNHSPSS